MNLPIGAFSFSLFVGSDHGSNCQLRTYRGDLLYHYSDRPFGTQQFFREAQLIVCDQAALLRTLEPCTRWNRSYYNIQVRNGEQWEIVIRFNGQEIKSYGSNAYPDDFEVVMEGIETIIGRRIPFTGRNSFLSGMAA